MTHSSEDITLAFLKFMGFPGIRKGEQNDEVCSYLKEKGYRFTPDLVAGPVDIKEAELEGLFFIDIIQPTSDMLFMSRFYEGYDVDVPKIFNEKLEATENKGEPLFIDDIPNNHHKFYLDSLNKKLDKYSHHRQFRKEGKQFVSANFGIVHYFNLGELSNNRVCEIKTLITVLDYIRFYKRLAPSDNIDLKNAENLILNEIINENQVEPFLLALGRELADLPCLFLMLHITILKQSKRKHLALLLLNISHFGNSDEKYPVHNWFKSRIYHPESIKHTNKHFEEKKFSISINPNERLFE